MSAGSALTAAGFWLGTVLPVLYVPVIVSGIDSLRSLVVFLTLLVVHVLALVVGHDHRRDR